MAFADRCLANNANYAATFDKGDLPIPPGQKAAVVTCMDARLDPARAFGLEEGDVHVIRNAGGVAATCKHCSLLLCTVPYHVYSQE